MKNLKRITTILIFLSMLCGNLMAGDFETISKTFKGIEELNISITSGDCEIISGKSKNVIVEVKFDVVPKGAFKPSFNERGKELKLSERWSGRTTRGRVSWKVVAPKTTDIKFSAASGDVLINNMNSQIDVNTASGDVEIENCSGDIEIEVASGDVSAENLSGDIEISTASGDIEIEDSKGDLELSTASGDIEASNLEGVFEMSVASGDIEVENIKGEFDVEVASGDADLKEIVILAESCFSAASGDIDILLAKTAEYDLDLSAASGNVTLDYNGNAIIGYIEMEAAEKHGQIRAPFAFDTQKEIERGSRTYIRKMVKIKKESPQVFIKTSSGNATLKK